jgi:hypothetical protein
MRSAVRSGLVGTLLVLSGCLSLKEGDDHGADDSTHRATSHIDPAARRAGRRPAAIDAQTSSTRPRTRQTTSTLDALDHATKSTPTLDAVPDTTAALGRRA